MGAIVAAIAATGLMAGAAALVSPLGPSHASLHLRQVAAQSAPVTTTMKGPISATAVPLLQGPGSGYPVTGYAQAFTPYAVTCFSSPEVTPGGYKAVTLRLRSSDPGNTTVRFFAMDPSSNVVWAPQNVSGSIPLSPPGLAGWSTMTWTVPAVSHVHAIGIQLYSGTGAPLAVAIDDVSW
jgi:hypothetical protein